jgi:hypothetical protein
MNSWYVTQGPRMMFSLKSVKNVNKWKYIQT